MVGSDKVTEGSTQGSTVERWTVGKQLSKQEIEKEEMQVAEKEECEKEKPDAIFLLKNTIDTILLEEVVSTGLKMNRYRDILAKGYSDVC